MRIRFTVLALALFFSACSPRAPLVQEPAKMAAPFSESGAVYRSLTADEFSKHTGPGLLFFARRTDPFSQKNELLLKSLYGSGAATISTYRIDFDTATGARLYYTVFVEDTFMLLSETGARISSIVHPNEEELRSLLRGQNILSRRPNARAGSRIKK